MHNLKLIIEREFLARVRNKTFVVMTFLSPLILVGMIMLIAFLANLNNDELKVVGVNDKSGMFASEFYDTEAVHFEDLSQISLDGPAYHQVGRTVGQYTDPEFFRGAQFKNFRICKDVLWRCGGLPVDDVHYHLWKYGNEKCN